jgi:hypothetical protein
MQVNLATTAGSLYATTLYVASGESNTGAGSLGPDEWTVPSTVAIGTVMTLTATGVLTTGTYSITVVSALPTINLKSGSLNGPVIATGTTIYSSTGALTFYSKANASAGYNSATTTIATIGTKINSNPWVQTLTPGAYKSQNTFSLFFPAGLNTLTLNATDNLKNAATTGPYNILVDPYVPTFTFASATTNTGCIAVTASSQEGDFNTATTGTGAFTATFNGVAIPSSSITFTGTQTLGTPGSVTANVCGLTTQTATFTVTGWTLAGLSGTASETLTVTVPFADSITFNTAGATYGTVGAYSGVTISVTNSWTTSQTVVIYATFKSSTSLYVAEGTLTLAAGATAPVFAIDIIPIPAGSYTVTFAAVTTSNQAVSAPTTGITLVT